MDQFVDKEHFMPFNYFKKQSFCGSVNGMRYMVRKNETKESDSEETESKRECLEAYVWPEPYAFEHTSEEKKNREEFDYSQTGVESAVDWINDQKSNWEMK